MWQTGMRAGSATPQAPPAAVPAAFSGAIIPAMSPHPRPQGKVQRLKSGLFLPSLVWQRQLVPLGEHACLEAAECAYDVGKMLVRLCSHQRCQERRAAGVPPLLPLLLPSPSPNSIASFSAPKLPYFVHPYPQLVRKLGGHAAQVEALKLHRPAATYTSHPRWQQLSGAHCSFEEACSLLAGGLAADFLQPAASRRVSRHVQDWQPAVMQAIAAAAAPAAADSKVASGDEESGGSGSGGSTPKRAGRPNNTSWSGLEPHDSGTYLLRLSASVATGAGYTSIPGASAVAQQQGHALHE